MKRLLYYIALIVCAVSTYAQTIPVFPGAVGHGSFTVAGRGGTLYRVVNLNDSGAGSLRNAMEASGRREIVFEISGTIPLTRNIIVDDPYMTVAGQTAPSPGITLKGASITVRTHDVLIQHIRVRTGHPRPDGNNMSSDCIEVLTNTQDCYNVLIDHVSTSWATDENMSVYSPNRTYQADNITFSNCIISEALMAGHANPSHKSDGLLVGSSGGATQVNISFIGNLLAFNNARNPTSQSQSLTFVNNFVYDWGGKATLARYESYGLPGTNMVKNLFIAGRDSRARWLIEKDPVTWPEGSWYYLDGNIIPQGLAVSSAPLPLVSSQRNWPQYTAYPADQVESRVLSQAGARPADRDAVDERIVEQVRTRTGGLINNQADVGGWPVLEVNRRVFLDARNPNADNDRDGYTNREEVLHSWLRFVGQPVPLTGGVQLNSTE